MSQLPIEQASGLTIPDRLLAKGGQLHRVEFDGEDAYATGLVDPFESLDLDFWTVTYSEPGDHPNQSATVVPGTGGNPGKLVLVDNAAAVDTGVRVSSPWFKGLPAVLEIVMHIDLVTATNWSVGQLSIEDSVGNSITIYRARYTDYRSYIDSPWYSYDYEGNRAQGEWIGLTFVAFHQTNSCDAGHCSLCVDNNNKPSTYAQLPGGAGDWQWHGRRRNGLTVGQMLRGDFRFTMSIGKSVDNPLEVHFTPSRNGMMWFR